MVKKKINLAMILVVTQSVIGYYIVKLIILLLTSCKTQPNPRVFEGLNKDQIIWKSLKSAFLEMIKNIWMTIYSGN